MLRDTQRKVQTGASKKDCEDDVAVNTIRQFSVGPLQFYNPTSKEASWQD